jgi:hypothetical protein
MDEYMQKPRFLFPALLLAVLTPVAALADDYRVEVKGSLDRDMPSGSTLGDANTFSLGSTWYFAPVSTDDVPLAEAAYLGRASNLSAIAARFEWEFESLDTHLNAQAARVGYYVPDTMFYAAVGVSRGQNVTAINSTIVQKEYVTTWFGTLGVAPLDGLLITTSLQEHGYDPNVTVRHVGKLPNKHYYAGSVSIVDPDHGDTSFGLDFDYYFDATSSLGFGYEDGGDRWELRAEKFLSKSWAAGASAFTANHGDGVGIHVTWRH